MKPYYLLITILFTFFCTSVARATDYNIVKFGAVGNGIVMNTVYIQTAIDNCAQTGGGRVIIPEGGFLTGSLKLKSGVELYLNKGAVLLGSAKWDDYEKNANYALILAKNQHHISIKGLGMIDGQGRELAAYIIQMWKQGLLKENKGTNRPDEKYRPEIIEFENCRDIHISGIVLKDASCWVQTYRKCQDLEIKGIKVNSTAYWNNDGLDIVDCRNVRISDCLINSADDGICLKSEDSTLLCKNISIKKCRIRSSASALKFGTASFGGFQDIKVQNLYVYDTYRSAIALECVDGGILKNVYISHVKAENTGNAIFLRLGKRNKGKRTSRIENVNISNVEAFIPENKPDKGYEMEGPVDKELYNTLPSSIVGLPGHLITNVSLNHISIHYPGGITNKVLRIGKSDIPKVPERANNYPEFSMFGELPAWGLYLRHVQGISLKNIKLTLNIEDYRPPFVKDDVQKMVVKHILVNGIKQTIDIPAGQ
jgi:polygalacturonase